MQQEVQLAACRSLQRLVDRKGMPAGVRLGDLVAKHAHPDTRAPQSVWRIDWESVLAEVMVAAARRNRRRAGPPSEAHGSHAGSG